MPRARFVIALAVVAALFMAARPGNEYQLLLQLNGQPTRPTLPDGGLAGLYSAGCVTLKGWTVKRAGANSPVVPGTILVVSSLPLNLCARPSSVSPNWDGGCNTNPSDENFGVPVQPYVPQYLTLDSAATSLCAATDAGSMSAPTWLVQ